MSEKRNPWIDGYQRITGSREQPTILLTALRRTNTHRDAGQTRPLHSPTQPLITLPMVRPGQISTTLKDFKGSRQESILVKAQRANHQPKRVWGRLPDWV